MHLVLEGCDIWPGLLLNYVDGLRRRGHRIVNNFINGIVVGVWVRHVKQSFQHHHKHGAFVWVDLRYETALSVIFLVKTGIFEILKLVVKINWLPLGQPLAQPVSVHTVYRKLPPQRLYLLHCLVSDMNVFKVKREAQRLLEFHLLYLVGQLQRDVAQAGYRHQC